MTGNSKTDGRSALQADHATRQTPAHVRLSEVVVLAGMVRPTPLSTAVARSLLDLPVATGLSLLQLWQQQAGTLAAALGVKALCIRVIVDSASTPPQTTGDGPVHVRIDRDPQPLRGTAGVLRDIYAGGDADEHLLLIHGPQLPLTPLAGLVDQMASLRADVAVVCHDNGLPSGLMLIRRRVLDQVGPVGFIDLKEQAMPEIAKRCNVAVVRQSEPSTIPIRTREDYIHALRLFALLQRNGGRIQHSPFEESWRTAFAVVEEGAKVVKSARLHDSVILRGAVVERDAIVAGSVIGPGAVVRAGRRAVNEVVGRGKKVSA